MPKFKILITRTDTFEKIVEVEGSDRAHACLRAQATLDEEGWDAVAGEGDEGEYVECHSEVMRDWTPDDEDDPGHETGH